MNEFETNLLLSGDNRRAQSWQEIFRDSEQARLELVRLISDDKARLSENSRSPFTLRCDNQSWEVVDHQGWVNRRWTRKENGDIKFETVHWTPARVHRGFVTSIIKPDIGIQTNLLPEQLRKIKKAWKLVLRLLPQEQRHTYFLQDKDLPEDLFALNGSLNGFLATKNWGDLVGSWDKPPVQIGYLIYNQEKLQTVLDILSECGKADGQGDWTCCWQ